MREDGVCQSIAAGGDGAGRNSDRAAPDHAAAAEAADLSRAAVHPAAADCEPAEAATAALAAFGAALWGHRAVCSGAGAAERRLGGAVGLDCGGTPSWRRGAGGSL